MIPALIGTGKAIGLGGRLLQGALGAGTLGGSAYGIYEATQIPKYIREDILKTDYNPETGKYDTNPLQNLLIDEGSLVAEKNKRIKRVAESSGFIEKAQGKDSNLVYKPGMTEKDFRVTYAPELEIIALKDRAAAEKFINADAIQTEKDRYRDKEYRLDQDRLDLLTQQSNNLEYQRSRDRRADMQYNENLARLDRKDRKAAISSATAGLAALAAAFAI
jgi:hypothetical protein